MVVFLLCLGFPLLDGGQTFVGMPFITHNCVGSETPRHGVGVAGILGIYIIVDSWREMYKHRSSM
jgi:hypothetical protein